MEYAKLFTGTWRSREVQRLSLQAKAVWVYLLGNMASNWLGIYYLPKSTMAEELGVSTERLDTYLREIEDQGLALYDAETKEVFVVNFLRRHWVPSPNMLKTIFTDLRAVRSTKLLTIFAEAYADNLKVRQLVENLRLSQPLAEGLGGVGEPLPNGPYSSTSTSLSVSKDQKEKAKKFERPTNEEIEAYFRDLVAKAKEKYGVVLQAALAASKFANFYDQAEWTWGDKGKRRPITDWRNAARQWVLRDVERATGGAR